MSRYPVTTHLLCAESQLAELVRELPAVMEMHPARVTQAGQIVEQCRAHLVVIEFELQRLDSANPAKRPLKEGDGG